MKLINRYMVVAIFALVAILTPEADARRSSSGGRSFSKPSVSRSKPSTSRTSTKPTSRSTTKSTAAANTKAAANRKSKADRANYEKAVKQGTSFKTRDAAVADFKSKHAGKYPSKYSEKPAVRPSHIPETTKGSDGKTYNVTYNPQQGGYVYYSGGGPGLGTFIMYDMMTDAIMMNSMMRTQGYHYGAVPPPVGGYGGVAIFFAILGGLVVVVIIIALVRSL